MSGLDHSTRLARIDVTRMVRKHTDFGDGASSVVSLLAYVLVFGAMTVAGGYFAYRGGQAAGTDAFGLGPFVAMDAIRGLVGVFWVTLTAVYVVRGVGQRGTLAQPEGVLTVVPTREALVGVLIAEYVYFLLWLLVPGASVGLGFALGTGTPWPVLTVPLGVAAAGATTVAVGYPVGLLVRHVVTRFPFVARNKAALVVVAFLAYFLALTTGAVDRLMVALFEPMRASPVGWLADLMFLGAPVVAASALRAAGAVCLAVGLAALAVVGGTRIADRHWFSDPALAGEDGGETAEERGETAEGRAAGTVGGQTGTAGEPTGTAGATGDSALERRLESAFGRTTGSLVALAWRRALRSPLKLLYAMYPLLFATAIGADIVQTGDVPAYLPYGVLLFVAWAAGVVFTLNPLGDQGAVLSATLLSRVDGRTFVRAHVLASLAVAVPLGVVVTAVVAVASPLASRTAAVLTAAVPVVMVLSSVVSMGVGMAFPRFEATSVTRSMETVLPSRLAFVLFTLYLFLTAAAVTVVLEPLAREVGAALLTWVLPFGLGVSPEALSLAATVAVVPLAGAPLLAYRFAVRRFDRYTVS